MTPTIFIDKLDKALNDLKTFEDSLNTAIFTTTFVVRHKKEITYVTHDIDDGAWQFFSNDSFENYEDVAMIIGLGEIINIDSSVLEVADLPLGFIAKRQQIGDKWTFSKRSD